MKTTWTNKYWHKCSYKNNPIRNIDFKIGRDISDNDYGEISTIDKNTENWYYLVQWTSDSYTFQYSHKIGRDVIKAVGLVCDAVYLNSSYNFNQWYNPYKNKIKGKTIVRYNTVILTKVRVKSINNITLPDIEGWWNYASWCLCFWCYTQ